MGLMATAKRRICLRSGYILLSCVLILCPTAALAEAGRDFAGFYDLTNITNLGTDYRVTLSLTVFNYRGSAVAGATITLEDSVEPGKTYGSFGSTISVGDRGSATLRGTFTVPAAEYRFWQIGSTPRVMIQFQDSAGRTVRRAIELSEMAWEG